MSDVDTAPQRMRASQMQMVEYLRDPTGTVAPDAEVRRLNIYRDLFYNNIEGFISSGFPVLRSLYADDAWHRLVRSFVRDHRCQTPLFPRISEEFLTYLMQEYQPCEEDPLFLSELAHYEWVELALDIADSELALESIDASADLMAGVPIVSPLAWSLAYSYPVHTIGPGHVPEAPGETPTYLIVYRDRGDNVRFMETNATTARLLQLLEENETDSGADILMLMAEELGTAVETIRAYGGEILEDFRRQSIVLGARAS